MVDVQLRKLRDISGALVLYCSIYNTVVVNSTYDVVVDSLKYFLGAAAK